MKFKIEGRMKSSPTWDTISHGDARQETISAQFFRTVNTYNQFVEFRLTTEPDTLPIDCAAGDNLYL